MLYWLSQFSDGPLRIFKYLTFRAGGAFITALLLVIIFGPLTVRLLKKFRAVAPLRLKGLVADEEIDYSKEKTPSMGGILIVLAVLVATALWAPLTNRLVLTPMAVMSCFALVGFWDDYCKVAYSNNGGVSGKLRLLIEFVASGVAIWFISTIPEVGESTRYFTVPFFKEPVLSGLPVYWMLLFGAVVITGSSNAVNLTDGLDGLATGCTVICVATYVIFAYLGGHEKFAGYLNIPFINGCGEMCVFGAAIIGACLGFLWHNCYPASMFMGDTGSLALGSSVGLIAVVVKQERTLLVGGGMFGWEAMSVMIQVGYFKYSGGKRVFLMAPIHHHYQKKGWTETQVVVRFWILAIMLAGLGLATLKLR